MDVYGVYMSYNGCTQRKGGKCASWSSFIIEDPFTSFDSNDYFEGEGDGRGREKVSKMSFGKCGEKEWKKKSRYIIMSWRLEMNSSIWVLLPLFPSQIIKGRNGEGTLHHMIIIVMMMFEKNDFAALPTHLIAPYRFQQEENIRKNMNKGEVEIELSSQD